MKNRQTAIILAFFLGGLGTHWFYVGKHWKALFYLLFCWTLIPAFASLFDAWSFYKLSHQDFQAKYGDGNLVFTKDGIATPETHIKCPDCRELIFKDARKCRYCGCQLTPQ